MLEQQRSIYRNNAIVNQSLLEQTFKDYSKKYVSTFHTKTIDLRNPGFDIGSISNPHVRLAAAHALLWSARYINDDNVLDLIDTIWLGNQFKNNSFVNNRKVAVYGYWRSGTNLLLSLFETMGFTNFEEFYEILAINKSNTQLLIDRHNAYLVARMNQWKNNKSIIKIMLTHTQYVSDPVKEICTDNVFIFRRNVFNLVTSKIIAETRKSWLAFNKHMQPLFDQPIDAELFKKELDLVLRDFTQFSKTYKNLNINYVVEYEKDLVPYVKRNPESTAHTESSNYVVQNKDELSDIYINQYSDEFNRVFASFDYLKMKTNKFDFDTFLKTLFNGSSPNAGINITK